VDLLTTPTLTFSKRETFGYSLNGKEILVPQGGSYELTDDTSKAIANRETGFRGTTAAILSGTNRSIGTDYNVRALTKAVNTGWTPRDQGTRNRDDDPASDILTLWGMADLGSDQTDVYALSMSYDRHRLIPYQFGRGLFGLSTEDQEGNWINAVDKNFGGSKRFVLGPWKPSYGLGTYGIDLRTHTVWAVINYNADFAVAGFRHFKRDE
jgi:hypothetical protein